MVKTLQYQQLFEPVRFLQPSVVQAVAPASTTGTSITFSVPSVGATHALVMGISIFSGSASVVSVSDDRGNSWFSAGVFEQDLTVGTTTAFALCTSAFAGTTNVTVKFSASVRTQVYLFEVANISAAPNSYDASSAGSVYNATVIDNKDGIIESASVSSHTCSPSGIATFSEGTFIMCVSTLSASVGTPGAGAGYTRLAGSGVDSMCQYQVAPGPFTAEKGAYTTLGSTTSTGIIVSFRVGPQTVGGVEVPWMGALTQQTDPIPRKAFANYSALIEPVTTPSVSPPPTWGWEPQTTDLTFPRKPAFSGISEQVDPTSYVQQNLGWLVQYPVAPPKTKVPDPGYFVHPVLWPIPANVAASVMVIWSDVSLTVPGFTSETLTVGGFTGETLIN